MQHSGNSDAREKRVGLEVDGRNLQRTTEKHKPRVTKMLLVLQNPVFSHLFPDDCVSGEHAGNFSRTIQQPYSMYVENRSEP